MVSGTGERSHRRSQRGNSDQESFSAKTLLEETLEYARDKRRVIFFRPCRVPGPCPASPSQILFANKSRSLAGKSREVNGLVECRPELQWAGGFRAQQAKSRIENSSLNGPGAGQNMIWCSRSLSLANPVSRKPKSAFCRKASQAAFALSIGYRSSATRRTIRVFLEMQPPFPFSKSQRGPQSAETYDVNILDVAHATGNRSCSSPARQRASHHRGGFVCNSLR